MKTISPVRIRIIRDYIIEHGLTQTRFCERSGITRATYNAMIRGRIGLSYIELFKVAKVIGVSIDELLGWD